MTTESPTKVNLAEKFSLFSEHWAPRLAASYNGNEVRLSKLSGEFHWHHHSDTDELFLIIKGVLDMEFRDGLQQLYPGELIVVPRGVEHRPCARHGEVQVLVMDADGTPNTGNDATAFKPIDIR